MIMKVFLKYFKNSNMTIATNNWYWVVQELNSQLKTWISLRVSSPGRSGGGAGKGRRACNYRYVRRAQRSYLWVIVKFYGWYHAWPLFLYCKIGQTVIWSTYKPGNICVYIQVFILYWIAFHVNMAKNILPVSHITCSCKAEYLNTWINYTILSIVVIYYCYYRKANYTFKWNTNLLAG